MSEDLWRHLMYGPEAPQGLLQPYDIKLTPNLISRFIYELEDEENNIDYAQHIQNIVSFYRSTYKKTTTQENATAPSPSASQVTQDERSVYSSTQKSLQHTQDLDLNTQVAVDLTSVLSSSSASLSPRINTHDNEYGSDSDFDNRPFVEIDVEFVIRFLENIYTMIGCFSCLHDDLQVLTRRFAFDEDSIYDSGYDQSSFEAFVDWILRVSEFIDAFKQRRTLPTVHTGDTSKMS